MPDERRNPFTGEPVTGFEAPITMGQAPNRFEEMENQEPDYFDPLKLLRELLLAAFQGEGDPGIPPQPAAPEMFTPQSPGIQRRPLGR